MINKFIYDNKSSSDYGIYISGSGTFNAPERDIEVIEIPGKNGSLTFDNGRFKNVKVTYPAFIRKNFKTNAADLREWLLKQPGYKKLEDTYHPDYYRLARYTGPIEFETRALNTSAEFSISFDCMPQRFLKSGEIDVEITEDETIINPTAFNALPLIKIYGTSGSLTVNNTIITITAIDEYVVINSELQDAYKGTENKNSTVTQDFPKLKSGENYISFTQGISKVIIKPRWWTI